MLLQVNLNGHVSFDSELPGYKSDLILPVGLPVIAPFLADIDTRLTGNVYYRFVRHAPWFQEMSSQNNGAMRQSEHHVGPTRRIQLNNISHFTSTSSFLSFSFASSGLLACTEQTNISLTNIAHTKINKGTRAQTFRSDLR